MFKQQCQMFVNQTAANKYITFNNIKNVNSNKFHQMYCNGQISALLKPKIKMLK